MFKIYNKTLLKLPPPSTSPLLDLLSSDDPDSLSPSIIIQTSSLLLQQPLPQSNSTKGKFMWEVDIFLRYSFLKLQNIARTFNNSIKSLTYGEPEINLENTMIQIMSTILKVTKKVKNHVEITLSLNSILNLSLPNLSALCNLTSSMKLIFYLLELKEHFEIPFDTEILNETIKDELSQTNYFTSILENPENIYSLGLKLAPEHFQYCKYQVSELQRDLDFEGVEWTGNSYISLMRYLEKGDVNEKAKKKQKTEFYEAVLYLTIYQTLKKGREDRQYLVCFIENYANVPLFQYKWLETKHSLSPDVNAHIDEKLEQVYEIDAIYSNPRSQIYFNNQLNKQYLWLTNYSLTFQKHYTNEYKDNLVRSIKYHHNISIKYNLDQKYFQRYTILMGKIFKMFHHIFDHPELYDDWRFDGGLENIDFDFNEGECQKLWLKLIALPVHKNITKMMYQLMTNVFAKTIERYGNENGDWKFEVWKTNKEFLIKFFKCCARDENYTDSDYQVFKDLLGNKDFKLNQKMLDNFLQHFYSKGLLQKEIKEYLIENIYYYNHKPNFYMLKIFTLQEKMNYLTKEIQEFKGQKKQITEIRKKYEKNPLLDKCLFENFEVMFSFVLQKVNKSARGLKKEKEEEKSLQFQIFIDKLLSISSESINFYVEVNYDEIEYIDAIMAVHKVLKSSDNTKHPEVLKYVLESQEALLSIKYSNKFSPETIASFMKLLLIYKIGYNSLDQTYYEYQDKKIPADTDKLPELTETFTSLVHIASDLAYTNLTTYIQHHYNKKQQSNESKVEFQLQIMSRIGSWSDLVDRPMDDRNYFFNIKGVLTEICKMVSVNIPEVQKIVENVFVEKLQSAEMQILTEGTDYQIFNSFIKEIFRVYVFAYRNQTLTSWLLKHKHISKIWNKLQDKVKQENEYFLTSHFYTLHQEQVVKKLQSFVESEIKTDPQLTEVFDIIFDTYIPKGFVGFCESDSLYDIQRCVDWSISESNKIKEKLKTNTNMTEKEREEGLAKSNDISITPVEEFIYKIYNHLHVIESSVIDLFVKQMKEVYPDLQEGILNELLAYLRANSYELSEKQKDQKQPKPLQQSKNKVDFQKILHTNRGKLNIFLIIDRYFDIQIQNIYFPVITHPEILTYQYSQEIMKPIKYLQLSEKLALYDLYLSKINDLIASPTPNIPTNKLQLILEIAFHTQAQITMYHPETNFYPEPFLPAMLSLYNTNNEFGDISKYLIFENLTPQKYEYNLREIIIFITKQMARQYYHPLTLTDGVINDKDICKVFDQHVYTLIKELPPPYSKSNIIGKIIGEIINEDNEYSHTYKTPLESYDWLIGCIIEPRVNYTQTNMHCAVINTVLLNPHVLDSLVKQITIQKLVERIEYSEEFLLVIVEYLSYKPEIFYELIDQIINHVNKTWKKQTYYKPDNRTPKDNMRPLLNLLTLCVQNTCNITNKHLNLQNKHYLLKFKTLSTTLVKSSPLSHAFLKKLSLSNFYKFLNAIHAMEYKIRIFDRISVYPGASTVSSSNFSNPADIFQRKINADLVNGVDLGIEPYTRYISATAVEWNDMKLDLNYLFWFEFKSKIGYSRKVGEILSEGGYVDVEYNEHADKMATDYYCPVIEGDAGQEEEKGEGNQLMVVEQKEQEIQKKQQEYQGEQAKQEQVKETKSDHQQQNQSEHHNQNPTYPIKTSPQAPSTNTYPIQLYHPTPDTSPHQHQPQQPIPSPSPQPYDTEFIQKVQQHKRGQIPTPQYIRYLNIDRQEFMNCNDEQDEYIKSKVKSLLVAKKKEFKKIILASEYLLTNGDEEFKMDLKEQERFINEEIAWLDQLKFKEFSMLKESEILRYLDLTPEAIKIISQRGEEEVEKNEGEDQEENGDGNQVVNENQNADGAGNQNEIKENQNVEENQIPSTQQNTEPATEPLQPSEEPPTQQPPPQPTLNQNQQNQNEVDGILSGLDKFLSAQQQQFNAKTQLINTSFQQITNSLELYLDIQQLSDELICFILYEITNQPEFKPYEYPFCISSPNNYLKFGNLITRKLYDSFSKQNLLPETIFKNKEIMPTRECYNIFFKIQTLNKIYSYLFFDTNSTEFTLAKYRTEDYEVIEEYPPIKFTPVKLFPLPKRNVELVRMIEEFVYYYDFDRSNSFETLSSYFKSLTFPLQKQELIFKKEDEKVIEKVQKSLINYCLKDPKLLEIMVDTIYYLLEFTFPDKMVNILGELLDITLNKTIELNKILINRMMYLKSENITEFNRHNMFEKRESVISKYRQGRILHDVIDVVSRKDWFENKTFLDGYAGRIADFIKSVLDYAVVYYDKIENRNWLDKNKNFVSFDMEYLLKITLDERIKKLRETFNDTENIVDDLLSSNLSIIINTNINDIELNPIDTMLIEFINHNGAKMINQTQCMFSLAPEIVKFYNHDIKSIISRQYIFEQNEGEVELEINRESIIFSTFNELNNYNKKKIAQSELSIKFTDEIGIDGGGLMNEFIQLFFTELKDCRNGLFSMTKEQTLIPSKFATNIVNYRGIFRTVGVIFGKCISENLLSIPLDLDHYIIELIYGEKVGSLEHIKSMDIELYNNLQWILENDVDELQLKFQIVDDFIGLIKEKELTPHGSTTNVTNQNKQQYVQKYVYELLINSRKPQLKQFLLGFYSVCPLAYLKTIYKLDQLKQYICGKLEFDIQLCKKQVELKSCSLNTNEVKWLFEIVEEMTGEEVEEFVVFVTGRKRLPWNKFEDFTISLTQKADSLPTANTCNFKLNLGLYENKEIMKKKLEMAIKETEGFHIY